MKASGNRQPAWHAIPKNQNAFDEKVTKSTVKCYHSPARASKKAEIRRTREHGSRDRIRTRSAADRAKKKKLASVISPRERLWSCLSTYYVSPLLIGHIWRSELRRPRHFRTYLIRGRRLTLFLHPCLVLSTNPLLFAVFASSRLQGCNIQPWGRLWPVRHKNKRITFDDRDRLAIRLWRNYRAIGLLTACSRFYLLFFSLPVCDSQAGPGRLFFRCCGDWQHRAPRDASLHSARSAT